MHIPSYPSIYQFGHRAVSELIKGHVIVEEKIDGSQFSVALSEGQLQMRSKGAEVHEGQGGMFSKAVDTFQRLKSALREGWVYRGEYLQKPKHNVLAYDRTPKDHFILFDVQTGLETYLSPEDKRAEAERLGLECVPLLYTGTLQGAEQFIQMLDQTSVLGSQKIEGVVVKPLNYDLFGPDKKCLLAKYVAPEFKEMHASTWTKEHKDPGSKDILQLLGNQLNTQARWSKAVIHMKEQGKLEGSPRDIGLLIREVPQDIEKECEEEIKAALYQWAMPQLRRYVVKGLAEWYKEKLLTEGLSEAASASESEPQADPAP